MAQVAAEQAKKDLRRLVDQSLLEAEPAEAHRDERIVGQELLERGADRYRSPRAEHVEQRPRLPVARIEPHRLLQMTDRLRQRSGPAVEIAGQAVGLRLVRARLE